MSDKDATGFRCVELPNNQKMWASANNLRVVVKRAPNRFQAYEYLENDHRHYSVGYLATRDDTRRFLSGQAVSLYTNWGENIKEEPLTFTHPSLVTF